MKKYNIFLVISGQATSIGGSEIWIRNFHDSLIQMGHTVRLLNTDRYALKHDVEPFSSQSKELLSNELPKLFSDAHRDSNFDIFFSYLHSGQIFPEVFEEIKKTGVMTVNYSTNYHQFPMYEEIAKRVDLNIYITKTAKEGFDRIGAKSYYMPLAANPTFYKPSSQKNYSISFVGSPYGMRPYYLWRVLQHGFDLKIHGPGWLPPLIRLPNLPFRSILTRLRAVQRIIMESSVSDDDALRSLDSNFRQKIMEKINRNYPDSVKPPLSDADYLKVIAESRIVINFNESRFDHDFLNHRVLLGANLRDFETTMSGTFLLTQFSDELSDFFHDGKEVVSFRNEHDLAEKLGYYSVHEDELNRIAQAGHVRARNDHTWEKRFTALFEHLGV